MKKGIPIKKKRQSRRRKPLILSGAVLLGVVLTVFSLWLFTREAVSSNSEEKQSSNAEKKSGEALAHSYCAMCHLFTEPAWVNRQTWKDQILPEMKARLGLDPVAVAEHPEAKYQKGIFPSGPMLSIEQWNLIESYYLSNAPELQPTGKLENIEVGVPGFEVELPTAPRGSPMTSLTFIDEKHGEILAGDAQAKALKVFDSAKQLRQVVPMDNIPVSVWPVETGIYVTCIGSIIPSDNPLGSLSFVPRLGDHYGSPRLLLSELPRPTQSAFGDLNGDGRDDVVISMFGHVGSGRFSWFENCGKDNFKEHILVQRTGTIQTKLVDFNGDGFLDILVLTAQQTESIEIFYNNGKGEFTSKVIFQKRPLWAHTHFELADFNGDGKPDLLVSNGATGEWFTSPLKSFHGLRIYLNRGDDKFEEAYFFRMNGLYQFVMGDFDKDGDLDIAAVSFYPDYRHASAESFVYLQNQGKLSFRAFTFPDVLAGRWMTVAAGDLDGDGDLDLVLGSKYQGPSSVPSVLYNNWKEEGPAFVVLRNQLRGLAASTVDEVGRKTARVDSK